MKLGEISSRLQPTRADAFAYVLSSMQFPTPDSLYGLATAYSAGVERTRNMLLDDVSRMWRATINRSMRSLDDGGSDVPARDIVRSLRAYGHRQISDAVKISVPTLAAQSRGIGDCYIAAADVLTEILDGHYDEHVAPPILTADTDDETT